MYLTSWHFDVALRLRSKTYVLLSETFGWICCVLLVCGKCMIKPTSISFHVFVTVRCLTNACLCFHGLRTCGSDVLQSTICDFCWRERGSRRLFSDQWGEEIEVFVSERALVTIWWMWWDRRMDWSFKGTGCTYGVGGWPRSASITALRLHTI